MKICTNGGTWFSPAPYTLTIPKPLIPIAGNQLYIDYWKIWPILDEPIDEIAFILGDPAFWR
jgi:glucose-1-phosphate thymidylyltransferase